MSWALIVVILTLPTFIRGILNCVVSVADSCDCCLFFLWESGFRGYVVWADCGPPLFVGEIVNYVRNVACTLVIWEFGWVVYILCIACEHSSG
jgi:hypothetical protein